MDAQLKHSVRSILYRENGKATVSHLLKTLRLQGYTKLGSAADFVDLCEKQNFIVEHQYRVKEGHQVLTRTFISLPEVDTT